MFPGSSPAARGETITLWATGFGPTSPGVSAGKTPPAESIAYVTAFPSVQIGGVPASVYAAALNPQALGLYQVIVTVPSSAPSGDQAVVASVAGTSSPARGVLIAVR
jgi:uncharacterized protein (TIGR03437 family)